MAQAHSLGDVIREVAAKTRPTGMVHGGGTGLSDSIPAQGPGGRPILLSQNEHITPADVVSMLGDGSSQAGHTALDKMHKVVRMMKTTAKGKQAGKFSWHELANHMEGKG